MELTCQRCHETLRGDDRYCPVCGLPQLLYVASEEPLTALGQSSDQDSESVGRGGGLGGGLNVAGGMTIAWRPALRAAMMLAVPAAVLCSGLTPIGLICMAGAAAWAVSLYSRRARTGWLSTGIGARIGLLTGLMASWLTLGMDGLSLWVERFLLHQGSQIDSLWTSQVMSNFDRNQQMVAQMGMATAQSTQFAQALKVWMLSGDGRAGIALSGVLTVAAFLILFGTVGGAVGARFLRQPRTPRV